MSSLSQPTSLDISGFPLSFPSDVPIGLDPTIPKPSTKRKSKQNTPAASTESLEIELLKRHLNLAQTKIVDLDNCITEKENRIKVLLARLKAFEEKETKEASERYFPKTTDTPAPSSAPTSVSSCCPSTWLHGLLHHQCQPAQPAYDYTKVIDNLSDKVNVLLSEMDILKVQLNNLEENKNPDTTTEAQTETDVPTPSRPTAGVSEIESSRPVSSASICDKSISSIEEFIFDDLPENNESNVHLNFFHPTTQPSRLRHQTQ